MGSEWTQTTLGSVIELKRGYDLPSQDRRLGSVPIVTSSGVSDYHAEAKVKGPGVVTGRYGTIGQVYYIQEDFWPHNTTLYVKDFKGNDPRFISYFLRTIQYLSYSDKAAVPGINRNHLHQALVTVPPLPEQRAIAAVLGSLDDKIELNRRMNATLEATARALFKSWFVDFDPVRAKMEGRETGLPEDIDALFPSEMEDGRPKGWGAKALDEIATYLNGLALQKYPPNDDEYLPVIKIAQLRKGNTDGADRASTQISPEYIIDDGDVLFSWSGSLEVVIWCGGRGALNQHLFKVTSNEYPRWFYYLWTREHLPDFQEIAAGKATTMGHIQRKHLTQAEALVPSHELLKAMNQYMEPIVERIIQCNVESRTLAALRDALLPKLMSGEVRVKDKSKV